VNYPSTEYLDLPFLDFVSFNVYLESPDRLHAYLGRLQNIAGDRPLLMSEVGLDAMRNGEAKQAEVLKWQIEISFAAGCAGVVIFSWTDEWHRAGAEVEDWAFGLTDRERRPKPSLAAVQRTFENVPLAPHADWPRISVVICTFNGARTIAGCLAGTKHLDYPDYEVIVVNDGSTDSTPEIARQFPCRLISTENFGLSNARNVGGENATGEIIAYLDDDATPDPHWLQFLANAFCNTDHAAIGGPNVAPSGVCAIAQCVDNAPGGPTHVLLDDELAEHLPGCNMAVRKWCFEAIGGFDSTFRVAGDDVDFCWRLQERGWTLGFAPGAVVLHHRRSSVSGFWRQQKGYGKAEALLEKKWPEKFNSAGHHTFGGRVYGRGLLQALFRHRMIYHGAGGFAPFQSIYEPMPGVVATLPLMPEWYLLILLLALISALGLLWTPLLVSVPFLILAVGASIAQAVMGGRGAIFSPVPGSLWREAGMRTLTGFLHLLQPVARLTGRLGAGLTAWRTRGTEGFVLPRTFSTAVWSEDWQDPAERLAAVQRALRRERNVFRCGGDFDSWDLEVLGGMFGAARMLMAVEDHGAGTQYVRARITPLSRASTKVLLSCLLLVLIAALSHHQFVVAACFAIPAFLTFSAAFRQQGRATAALRRAIHSLAPPPSVTATLAPPQLADPKVNA
jgi:GT2 family glycosyltransferase